MCRIWAEWNSFIAMLVNPTVYFQLQCTWAALRPNTSHSRELHRSHTVKTNGDQAAWLISTARKLISTGPTRTDRSTQQGSWVNGLQTQIHGSLRPFHTKKLTFERHTKTRHCKTIGLWPYCQLWQTQCNSRSTTTIYTGLTRAPQLMY